MCRVLPLSAFFVTIFVTGAQAIAENREVSLDDLETVLSAEFRECFGPEAPLNAESYGCLDQEYKRLDALLSKDYRSALARQRDDAARRRLQNDQRRWWGSRFRHCKDEVGDLRGSTAAVVNELCEINAVAKRVIVLRRFPS